MAYAFNRRALPALAGVFVVLAGSAAATAARAQHTPQIAIVPADSHPPIPSDMVLACWGGPETPPSSTCPVIQYGDITTWAYRFLDNRVAYGLVSYDAKGSVVRNVTRNGARYVYKMTSDPAARTISIWGQGDGKVVVPWSDLPQVPPKIIMMPIAERPPEPEGLRALCPTGPSGSEMSSTCPVISYRNAYTWGFSFVDNRFSLGITSYDGQAHELKSVTKEGARYLYKITVDPTAQTVTLWGQHDMKIVVPWAELP
jgi:hypothetical protein